MSIRNMNVLCSLTHSYIRHITYIASSLNFRCNAGQTTWRPQLHKMPSAPSAASRDPYSQSFRQISNIGTNNGRLLQIDTPSIPNPPPGASVNDFMDKNYIAKTQFYKEIKILHNILFTFCRFVSTAAPNDIITVKVEFSLLISINIKN